MARTESEKGKRERCQLQNQTVCRYVTGSVYMYIYIYIYIYINIYIREHNLDITRPTEAVPPTSRALGMVLKCFHLLQLMKYVYWCIFIKILKTAVKKRPICRINSGMKIAQHTEMKLQSCIPLQSLLPTCRWNPGPSFLNGYAIRWPN